MTQEDLDFLLDEPEIIKPKTETKIKKNKNKKSIE